jgi:hypothetical protein
VLQPSVGEELALTPEQRTSLGALPQRIKEFSASLAEHEPNSHARTAKRKAEERRLVESCLNAPQCKRLEQIYVQHQILVSSVYATIRADTAIAERLGVTRASVRELRVEKGPYTSGYPVSYFRNPPDGREGEIYRLKTTEVRLKNKAYKDYVAVGRMTAEQQQTWLDIVGAPCRHPIFAGYQKALANVATEYSLDGRRKSFETAIYHPDAQHLWNRLHAALLSDLGLTDVLMVRIGWSPCCGPGPSTCWKKVPTNERWPS